MKHFVLFKFQNDLETSNFGIRHLQRRSKIFDNYNFLSKTEIICQNWNFSQNVCHENTKKCIYIYFIEKCNVLFLIIGDICRKINRIILFLPEKLCVLSLFSIKSKKIIINRNCFLAVFWHGM